MIRDEIKKIIKEAILKAQKEKKLPDFKIPKISVEHPEKKEYGDYSTNIAMICSKLAKKAPMQIAKALDFKRLLKSIRQY